MENRKARTTDLDLVTQRSGKHDRASRGEPRAGGHQATGGLR
jgi:hypothetical protein